MQLSSVIVYGFCEGEPDIRINPEWLETEYPDIGNYALYLESDGCMGEVCYGIPCVLDSDTGRIMIEDVSKNKVKELFDQVSNYIVEGFSGKLGFYSVVGGDFYSYHLMYIPMDVDDSESDLSCSVETDDSESDTSCTMDDSDTDTTYSDMPPLVLPSVKEEEEEESPEECLENRNSEKSVKSSEWEEL